MASAKQLIETLGRAPGMLIPLMRQADPAIVKRRPPSGKWSIHEHARHLAEVHPLFFTRPGLMPSEDDPAIRSYDPGRGDPPDALLHIDLDEALRRFRRDRSRVVKRLRQFRPEEWKRTARHDEYNSYSVFTMFRHLALHDFFHADRIEELLLRKEWPSPSAILEAD